MTWGLEAVDKAAFGFMRGPFHRTMRKPVARTVIGPWR
jgi:hypothetical protein